MLVTIKVPAADANYDFNWQANGSATTGPRAAGWLKVVIARHAANATISHKERLQIVCLMERQSQEEALQHLNLVSNTIQDREERRCQQLRRDLQNLLAENPELFKQTRQGTPWARELRATMAEVEQHRDWDIMVMERAFARALVAAFGLLKGLATETPKVLVRHAPTSQAGLQVIEHEPVVVPAS
jgi:hypothetical protein